jgi:hypothetical protein
LRAYFIVFTIVCLNSFCQDLYAQEGFATIEKNVNISARGLFHDLNKTKDSLVLKSDKKMDYIYSLNKDNIREVDNSLNTNLFKLSLKNLTKGKHVFVVSQSQALIVFVIRVLEDKIFDTTVEVGKLSVVGSN